MIDFRFFLMSIVAVFLALGIGIVMGSGVLGGPILEGLERRADSVVERNDALRDEISGLETRLDQQTEFSDLTEPLIVNGELAGEDVVLVEAEGTDGTLLESVETLIGEAGGNLSTRLILTDRFALEGDGDVEALADVMGTQRSSPEELRVAAGTEIGSRLGASAAERPETRNGFERLQALEMLEDLQAEDFIAIDNIDGEPVIPSDALFVIAAGGAREAPYETSQVIVPLAGRADARGAEALVTEPTESAWGVVADVRADPTVSDAVTTVDNGDAVPGRVSIALSLPLEGPPGHWGTDEGAEGLVAVPPG